MAKTRRTVTRSGRKRSRGWLWLIVGLALGAALMYGVQAYLYRDGKPFPGLAGLFQPDRRPAEKKDDKQLVEANRLPKPKLDFYTILPGETVLPDIKADKKKAEAPEKGVSYILQAAAFTAPEDADRLKAKLVLNGLEPHIEKITVGDKGTYYRVRLGPYSNVDSLDAANHKLSQLGIRALRIKVKKGAG